MNANYLSDEYHADIAKVDAIRSLTGKGLGSLVGAYDTHSGMWPYSLKEGEAIEPPPSLSIVTNAMTIHSIGISVGAIQNSVLVPGIRRQRTTDPAITRLAENVHATGTKELIDHLHRKLDQHELTTSKTWGGKRPTHSHMASRAFHCGMCQE